MDVFGSAMGRYVFGSAMGRFTGEAGLGLHVKGYIENWPM